MTQLESIPNQENQKISSRVSEILKETHKIMLPAIIKDLKQYCEIRQFNETDYDDLPQEDRATMDRGEKPNFFMDKIDAFDSWYDINDFYGPGSENAWTLDEVKALVSALQEKITPAAATTVADIKEALK